MLSYRPTRCLLDLVMPSTFGTQIGFAGRTSAVDWIMRDAVFHIAAVSRYPAARELAGLVPADHQAGEVLRRPVTSGAVVNWPARCRISAAGALLNQAVDDVPGRRHHRRIELMFDYSPVDSTRSSRQ
jgi:hypothetical protein